ncbi:uncharacterized protein [Antedon mediterranea]|uniref:uncharacterized protein n=1 Tax=Antedon mediterranea TaxID=105859 RepID=UPI003AF5C31B
MANDDNQFMSCLLKLQEAHLQIVKKLKDEVCMITTRYQKVHTNANQSAHYAKKYYTKCKLMLNEREMMKTKMQELMKDKICKKCKETTDQHKTCVDASTENFPSSVVSSTIGSNLSPVKKPKGKLRRKKGVSSVAVSVLMTKPLVIPITGQSSKESNTKIATEGRFNESDYYIGAKGDNLKMAFVPDTFPSDMSLDISDEINIPLIDDSDIKTPDVKGIMGRDIMSVSIPDTCTFPDDEGTVFNTQDKVDGPQYTSTQIAPQLEDNSLNLRKENPSQMEDYDLTMIQSQSRVLKVPPLSSTPNIPKIKKARQMVSKQDKQKNGDGQTKWAADRCTSLPRSESQYPVDLNSTQIPSPTFQRDISAVLTKEDEEKAKNASRVLEFSVQKTPSVVTQKTPVSSSISMALKTPSSASLIGDESYMSDESPLLLREPKIDFQKIRLFDKTSKQEMEEETPSTSKKRKLIDENTDSKNIVESKRRYREDNTEKEMNLNSPAKHRLVQKTLSCFNGSNKGSSDIRTSNKGSITCDDTQQDIYFQEAVKQSLKDFKTSEFKKPFVPVKRRTLYDDQKDGSEIDRRKEDSKIDRRKEDREIDRKKEDIEIDHSFLNGTIDPAIDLSEFDKNTPQTNDLANHKPVLIKSGTVCIVKEVPCILDDTFATNMQEGDAVHSLMVDKDVENLSEDDMFGVNEEYEEHDGDMANVVEDEKPKKLPVDSFIKDYDVVPSVAEEKPTYKYVEVVRKQADRRKLRGFECKDCEAYFSTMDLTDSQKADRMKACSRHRGHYSPPATQPHYWDVDFPNTQICLQKGYINNASKEEEETAEETRKLLGRRKKYKRNFKSKTESTSKQK